MATAHLVIAEDDRAVRESVTRALELEGYEVEAVADGVAALEAASREGVDLLILDLGMPHIDGLTVCRRLRSAGSRLPILVLTARTEVADRVSGLDAGADDYLPKPFSLDELLARLRSLLRRSTYDAEEPTEVTVEDLVIDEAARRAWRGEREMELTKTEFDLLQLLAHNAGVVLSHSTIYDRIWGYDFGPDSKALAVYIGYLRRKTEEARRAPPHPDRARRGLHVEAVVTLRAKMALALAVLAGLAALLVGVTTYVVTEQRVRAEVDRSLESQAEALADTDGRTLAQYCAAGQHVARPAAGPGEGFERLGGVVAQCLDGDGQIIAYSSSIVLPVDEEDLETAEGGEREHSRPHTRTVTVDGVAYRVTTVPIDYSLHRRRCGAAGPRLQRVPAGARRPAPLDRRRHRGGQRPRRPRRLADRPQGHQAAGAAHRRRRGGRQQRPPRRRRPACRPRRARSPRPCLRHDARRPRPVARPAAAAGAGRRPRAAHPAHQPAHQRRDPPPLRQPARAHPPGDPLRPRDRDPELGTLVDELVQLATDTYDDEPEQIVALDHVVDRVAERVRRRTGRTVTVTVAATPCSVVGKPRDLARAIGNLVDNAAKFSEAPTPVEVTVDRSTVVVRDHGPGIPEADLPHVFTRFYRSPEARSKPGSGLGLSIVDQTARAHEGSVTVVNAPDGGAVFTFALPEAPPPPPPAV